jgi:hypothetical protein
MKRQMLLPALGLVLLLTGLGAGGVVLVRHEPSTYLAAEPPEGPARQKLSVDSLNKLHNFYQRVQDDSPEPWSQDFTEEGLNSFFAEDFVKIGGESYLPSGFHAPRVLIEPDKIRLGCRYGEGPWSTVISLDLRVWLPKDQPNVVAVELQGLHAGSLPISSQSLLERIYEAARQHNIDVTWYRHDGNPVALLRFQAEQRRPTVQLHSLELQKGKLRITGRSSASFRVMLPSSLTANPTP